MKRLLLMSVMLLGSATLFAQLLQNCFTFTNTLQCKLNICVSVDAKCGDDEIKTLPLICTGELGSGESGTFCIPASYEECTYTVRDYKITNELGEEITLSGTQATNFTLFLSGQVAQFVFPQRFSSGDCTEFLVFTHDGDKINITQQAENENSCGRFCFRNETGCFFMQFCVSSSTGNVDDPCTPEVDGMNCTEQCISLGDGTAYPTEGCIDFGINHETGCYWCPEVPVIRVCSLGGPNAEPCFEVGLNGGQGLAKCENGETPFSVVLILENGVYVLRRL